MRGRPFREGVPQAYGLPADPRPPVPPQAPRKVSQEEAIRIAAITLTRGEERFKEAEALARTGNTKAAIQRFEELCRDCRTLWIDRVGRERIAEPYSRLMAPRPEPAVQHSGNEGGPK